MWGKQQIIQNKHTDKRCSASQVIHEMEIKTIKFPFTYKGLVRIFKIW